jgi:hypothetical protein
LTNVLVGDRGNLLAQGASDGLAAVHWTPWQGSAA